MKMKVIAVLLSLIAVFAVAFTGLAQEEEDTLQVRFSRDFGYGGFGGEIQGTFSIRVVDQGDLERVEYYMDGELVQTETEAPFHWQFNTSSFEPGEHSLWAVGYRPNGDTLRSAEINREFLTSEEAGSEITSIIVPLLVIIAVITVLGVALPMLLGRNKKFAPGVYGAAGGAICPRCKLPFSRHVLGPNLVVGKLERCPHCGKISIVPAASKSRLEEAEKRLISEGVSEIQTKSEEEKMQERLDDSRFMDR